jgi:hypothetical protein
VTASLLKRGIRRTPRPEVLERFAKLDNRHLRSILRDFEHPRELFALDGIEWPTQRLLRWLGQTVVSFPGFVLPLPLGQRPVVGKSRRTCRLGKVGGLFVVRVQRDL